MLAPLERILKAQRAEVDPYRRAWRIIDVFEWVVKWETAVVVGDLLDRFAIPTDLRISLARSLARPSLGHWLRYLDLALALDPKDRPYRSWDRVLALEQQHQFVSFRNAYAHGAVERDEQAQARCERFEPVLDELLETPFIRRIGLSVVTATGTLNLGGPQPEGAPPGPYPNAEGTYAWVPELGVRVWLWPLAAYLTDRLEGHAGLYFHNAVRARRIESLNYDLPDQARRPDLLPTFHERLPLDRWRSELDPAMDPNRLRVLQLTEGLVGRDDAIESVVSRIVTGGSELVMLGAPGQGKSALLAAVLERLRDEDVYVIDSFLRRGDAHSLPETVLRSWVLRISHHLGRRIEAAEPLADLGEQLRTLLVRWSTQRDQQLVLMVDGLDERPELLSWLPASGGNVRLLWSARSTGEVMAAITTRAVPASDRWQVEPLQTEAVRAVLYQSVDKLDVRLTESFVSAVRQRSAGNPLFLTALSDLLYDRPELIGQADLLPTEIAELFEDAVDRASDRGRDEDCLGVLHLLAVAQEQLTSRQIAGLLGVNRTRVRRSVANLGELLRAEPPDSPDPRFGLYHEAVHDWLTATDPESLADYHELIARAAVRPDQHRATRSYLARSGATHLAHLVVSDKAAGREVATEMIENLSVPGSLSSRSELVGAYRVLVDVARLHAIAIDNQVAGHERLARAILDAVRPGMDDRLTVDTGDRSDDGITPNVLHDALIYRSDQRFATAVYEKIAEEATGDGPIDAELRVMLAGRLRRQGDDASRAWAQALLARLPSHLEQAYPRVAARAAYERAYLHHLEDEPDSAIAGMQRSEALATKAADATGSWIARCVANQFRYHAGTLDHATYERFLSDAAAYFQQAEAADTAASRWVTNVAAHLCDLQLDIGALDRAEEQIELLAAHPWIKDTGRERQLASRRRLLAVAVGRARDVVDDLERDVRGREKLRPVREGRARDFLDLASAQAAAGSRQEASHTAERGLASPRGCATWPWRDRLLRLADLNDPGSEGNGRSGPSRPR